ncbi:RNA polymerase sigma factor [Algoriphagus hitonicola]|uniref:RNA polymerase sigma-70 factor, ECF subfamily n=1 Tax=Algoriphagus hitonicola TaxID=435880 RepID=A0A1I2SWT2_9BACT|nr:RNA polymerase sigma factor [Algoriphagus hitonicola]SFG57100.1 RNA polymerase sigma-70 factor, ECF subfamily [Algoriphagus hitonicola]
MNNNPKIPNIEHVPIYPPGHSESIKVYESKSDLDIWNAFNNGDENAFNYIYRMYVAILFKYGCQMYKDQNHVQDCIQNIFIDLRRKRGNLSEVQSIKSYLFKILYRELIRKTKKEIETVNHSLEKMSQSFSIEFSQETKIIDLENQEEKSYRIQTALNKLTCRQRQAILLLYEEGMSYKEIMVAMELNEVKSARKVIYRALATLKSLLIKN